MCHFGANPKSGKLEEKVTGRGVAKNEWTGN